MLSNMFPNFLFQDALATPTLRYLRWRGDSTAVLPTKMTKHRKLLEMCTESPESGARFVLHVFDIKLVYVETGLFSRQ